MSGPIDPFDGEAGGAGAAPTRICRGRSRGPTTGRWSSPRSSRHRAEDETESRTSRRAARSARVRRRRRILFGIGGGLLVIILAFVLWYELEAHALGSPGPQVVVTVHQGESTDSIVDALSRST